MAKRKKAPKPKRAKLRRGNSAKRSKPRKAARSAARRAKPKRAPVKKLGRKVKSPVPPAIETVAAEVIEQPAPVEQTEIREAS